LPILGDEEFDPVGLPNTGSADFGWPGLDRAANPTFDEMLDVRARGTARFREFLDTLTPADLVREVDVLENGTTPVNECLYTVFEEEFHHNRYALRDLAQLE
jgi:DinB superfamily